jgi:RimJ/RimL family protein N-acetyltransferase
MPHTIRTDRLLLREASPRDARGLARNLDDWAVLKETQFWAHPLTPEVARFMLKDAPRQNASGEGRFLVFLRGEPIGLASLVRRRSDAYGLGYMIGRPWWGQGIAHEAVRALCAFGFRTLRARRIEADVFRDNQGSIRVLEKAGFRRVADPGPGWSATRRASFPRRAYALTREALR